MSAAPLTDSLHGAAGLEVMRAVAVARRRIRTVSMLRLAAATAPAGVTAGAALALAGLAPAWTAGVLGLVGAAAAGAWAAGHTPTVAHVAGQLDTQLGLRDRVAAAVQLQHADGPIAALVMRDAAARLAPLRVAAVFPLAIGRVPAVVAAIAVASVAWLVSIDARARTTTPAAPGAGQAADAGSPVRDRTHSDSGSDVQSDARAAEAPARRVIAPGRDPQPGATDGGAVSREAFAPASARGDRPAEHTVRESHETAQAADNQSRNGSAAPAVTNAPGRNARGGAGAGAASRGGLIEGAGGVTSRQALAATAGVVVPARGAGSYRTARASAEAALARDVIPPDYRDHVRAYFRALGQEGTR